MTSNHFYSFLFRNLGLFVNMQKMSRKMLKPRVKKCFLSKRPHLRNWPVVSTTQFVFLPKLMDTALQKFQFKPNMKKSLKKILTIKKNNVLKKLIRHTTVIFQKKIKSFHSKFSPLNPTERIKTKFYFSILFCKCHKFYQLPNYDYILSCNMK